MFKAFNIKDRLFLVFLLLWQIAVCGATCCLLSSLPDQQTGINPAAALFDQLYPIITTIIAALGSFVLIWFTLYQLRKTGESIFFWLLVVNLLSLIAPALSLISSKYQLQFDPGSARSMSVITTITTIQVYAGYIIGVISLFVSIYAFAAYAMNGRRWRDELRILRTGGIVLMLTLTVLMAVYLIIPDWLVLPSRLTYLTPLKILTSLSPLLLLWVVSWQYCRTRNPFFRLFAWAFSLDAIGCLIRNSTWYLTRAGILSSGFPSSQPLETSIQYNIIRWIIIAVVDLAVLVIEAYALAGFKNRPTA